MKTKIMLFFLLTYLLTNAQIPSFATKKSLGYDMVARMNAGMLALNDKIYILGGYANSSPKDFTEYDPATGVLTKLKNLGSGGANGLTNKCLFAVQNKIYFFSASGTGISEYNFSTNKWISNLLNLPAGLNPDAGFVINDIIYLCSQQDNNFYAYNPVTNILTQKANYPGLANRRGGVAFEISGKGYFGSGTTYFNNGCMSNSDGCYTDDFYQYNPTADIWTVKASLPTKFVFGVGTSRNGKGYAGTGEAYASSAAPRYRTFFWYEYNPLTNVWISKQNFLNNSGIFGNFALENLSNSSISVIGDDIYLFGGYDDVKFNKLKDNVYKYNVPTDNWLVVNNDLGQNRTEATGFYLNNKIYVGGGHDDEGLNDFWEYDIITKNWTQKANLPSNHCQRACVEINGKGYFVGGYGGSVNNTLADANANYTDELLEYNPTTNIFTPKAPFPYGKRGGMTAFEYNGNLFVGLGNNFNGQQTNNFYKYNPPSNSWTALANAPITGGNLSSFRIGNIGYIIAFNPQPIVAKYNFDTNIWTTETHNIGLSSNYYNNQAFAYNGVGYLVNGAYNTPDIIHKYNPATNTWSQVTNLPFKNPSQTIIPANDGVYFGFGNSSANHPIGISNSNELRFMKFDAIVSNKFGMYKSEVNFGYTSQTVCGTGNLSSNASHSVYDVNGDLFSTVIATDSQISGACYEVTAIDLAIPFKTATQNFGNGISETAMFLNKNTTFPTNTSALAQNTTLRLYYTTFELNKLVTDFNTLYGTTKTINDIKIVRYFNYDLPSDNNPLNNTFVNYTTYATSINNYGTDKYFDLILSNSSPAYGEIYAVLLTGENLGINALKKQKIKLFPNPSSSVLNIETQNNAIINKIVIADLTGKKVVEQSNTNQVNVANLAKGLYVVEAFIGEEKWVSKFIKE